MILTLEIPDQVAANLPDDEGARGRSVLLEMACGMFAARKLSHAQAAGLAGLGRLEFERELGARDIPIHYTLNDWKDDLDAGLCGE